MDRAMLIMDMPSSCIDCPCSYVAYANSKCEVLGENIDYEDNIYKQRPTWCPLREVPQKKKAYIFETAYDRTKRRGYNACIDEILGGGE